MEEKRPNWVCRKKIPQKDNGMEYECSSRQHKEISVFNDGTIRFSKDFEGPAVKVNGKISKLNDEESYGVELE